MLSHFLAAWQPHDLQFTGALRRMLTGLAELRIFCRQDALAYIGERFRHSEQFPKWRSDVEIGQYIIEYLQ